MKDERDMKTDHRLRDKGKSSLEPTERQTPKQ